MADLGLATQIYQIATGEFFYKQLKPSLVIQNLEAKWDKKTYNWKEVINALTLNFEERMKPHRFD
jgi:hypothetical protein